MRIILYEPTDFGLPKVICYLYRGNLRIRMSYLSYSMSHRANADVFKYTKEKVDFRELFGPLF